MLKRDITNELSENFINYLNKLDMEKNNKDYDRALLVIDIAFKDIFKLGKKFFDSFATENLIDMTNVNGKPSTDKCIMMAKLLEEEGSILEIQNKLDDAFYINQKSLNIFLDAYSDKSDNCTLENYFLDIDNLIDNVMQYKIPISLEIKIRDYYTEKNRYDKADNIAYDVLEENNYDPEIINNTLEFYNKLLLKDESDLNDGWISKSEIKDSIEELKSKL